MFFGIVKYSVTIITVSVTICLIVNWMFILENFEIKSTILCYFYLLFVYFIVVYKIIKVEFPPNVTCYVSMLIFGV